MTDAPAPIGHNRPHLDVLTKPELIEDHPSLVTDKASLEKDYKELPTPPASDADVALWQAWGVRAAAFLKAVEEKRKVLKEPYKQVGDSIDGFFNMDLRNVIAPLKVQAEGKVGAYQQQKERERRAAEQAAAAAAQAEADAKRKASEAAAAQGDHTKAEILDRQADAFEGEAATSERRAEASGQDLRRTHSAAGTTGSRSVLKWEYDRSKLSVAFLRKFLSDEAISDAIRAYATQPANKEACKAACAPSGVQPLVGVTFREEVKASFRSA